MKAVKATYLHVRCWKRDGRGGLGSFPIDTQPKAGHFIQRPPNPAPLPWFFVSPLPTNPFDNTTHSKIDSRFPRPHRQQTPVQTSEHLPQHGACAHGWSLWPGGHHAGRGTCHGAPPGHNGGRTAPDASERGPVKQEGHQLADWKLSDREEVGLEGVCSRAHFPPCPCFSETDRIDHWRLANLCCIHTGRVSSRLAASRCLRPPPWPP